MERSKSYPHCADGATSPRPLLDRLYRVLRLRLNCLERRSRLRRSLRILEVRLESLTKLAATEAAACEMRAHKAALGNLVALRRHR
jgi:hypothetical protein